MRGFFRNAGLIALAEIVARLKGLLLLPLLTHHLGTVDYGAWSQVVVITALVPLFILLGTDSGVVRYLPGRPLLEQQRSFFGWLITLIGLTGVVCVALYFARTWVAVAFFGSAEGYAAFVPLAAASIFVTVLLSGIRGWLRLQLSAWGWAGLTVGQAVLSLLATVVAMNASEASAITVYSTSS